MTAAPVARPAAPPRRLALRSIGYWMAVAAGGYGLVNVIRATVDPAGFARYLGLPLAAAPDTDWVLVYALRTAVIGLVVLALAVRRDLPTLALTAAASVIMPVGDALLVSRADADPATVARHLAIAAYLAVTATLLVRAASARGGTRRGPTPPN